MCVSSTRSGLPGSTGTTKAPRAKMQNNMAGCLVVAYTCTHDVSVCLGGMGVGGLDPPHDLPAACRPSTFTRPAGHNFKLKTVHTTSRWKRGGTGLFQPLPSSPSRGYTVRFQSPVIDTVVGVVNPELELRRVGFPARAALQPC